MTPGELFWGMMFGVIGIAFFMYGKKQNAVVPLASGFLLMVFPYFVSNTWLMLAIGAALVVAPYFIRL